MHELGVAFHVIREVNGIAKENGVGKINSVTLQLGEVSTVIPEYLTDVWQWAVKKETVLKDAELKIERIDAVTFCEDCRREYPTVRYGKTCPYCSGGNTYLVRGNEFIIKEIEVFDS